VTLFTASGRKYNSRSCREFRGGLGLPILELHMKLLLRNTWSITLAGSDTAGIATGAPQVAPSGNFTFTFTNVAAVDVKSVGDKNVMLVIERHGRVLGSLDVVDGDRMVAEVRESIHHSKKAALLNSLRRTHRPALEIIVTLGVDLSLVRSINETCRCSCALTFIRLLSLRS
jgi:hypothetical protein